MFSRARAGGPACLRKPELDTSKLRFSTGNGRSVTGNSKSEIKLCYIFGGLAGGCVVGAEMQSFWADFIHVAACQFPPGRSRDATGAARPLGAPSVYMECVRICESLCARVRACFCGCAQKQAAPGEALWKENLQLSASSPGFGHRWGRGRKKEKVCVRARVCARAGERGWWGQVGNSPMLIKTPPTSSPKPLPLCCLSESETSKGRIPVKLPMLGHPYL